MEAAKRRIELIKSFRSLTKLLGALGFRNFVVDHDEIARNRPKQWPAPRPPWRSGLSYGIGLKEAKDAVDAYMLRNNK
jgi:hypothetical protein